MTSPPPIVVRTKPDLFMPTVRTCVVLGLGLVGFGVLVGIKVSAVQFFAWMPVIVGAIFLWLGVMNFGIAKGRPVALRLDGDGASGYYVPSLTWNEVARVGISGSEDLAFEVNDHAALRNRQTTVMRRMALSTTFDGGWHILVPQSVLDVPVRELAASAQAFLDAQR